MSRSVRAIALGGAAFIAFAPWAVTPCALAQGSTQVSGVTVTAHRPAEVSGVTVTNSACPDPEPARYPADRSPRVVDSYPAPGEVVAPGVVEVRATFDAPMACYWAVVSVGGDDASPCRPDGVWDLPGRTTWRMQCRLVADAGYTIRFGGIDGHDFYGMSGRRADRYVLRFRTSDAAPVASLAQARAADPGPPGARVVTAYVTCTDRRFGEKDAPCRRVGAAETGETPPQP